MNVFKLGTDQKPDIMKKLLKLKAPGVELTFYGCKLFGCELLVCTSGKAKD